MKYTNWTNTHHDFLVQMCTAYKCWLQVCMVAGQITPTFPFQISHFPTHFCLYFMKKCLNAWLPYVLRQYVIKTRASAGNLCPITCIQLKLHNLVMTSTPIDRHYSNVCSGNKLNQTVNEMGHKTITNDINKAWAARKWT